MSTTATDNTSSPYRNTNTANQSANFVNSAKNYLYNLFKRQVNQNREYSRDPKTPDEFRPLLQNKWQTTKNAFGTGEGTQIDVLQNKSSVQATIVDGEIRIVIDSGSQAKLLNSDSVKEMELNGSKPEQEGDALMMNEADQQSLKDVWSLLMQIKKDANSSAKLLKKLNAEAAKDAKATARVLHCIRNRILYGPEVSLKDRGNGLLSFYSVLKKWGQEGAATLELYATLDSFSHPEALSRQILAKFSETTIVIVKIVVQEEMRLGTSEEKANYWCGVLQQLKEHCLLQDIQHSKSYLVLAFHHLLSELTNHEETKLVLEKYASCIKENLAQLVEKVIGNKKLPMDSLIRSTVAITYRQCQFLMDFSKKTDSSSEAIAGVLSRIYKLTRERCLTEKHKSEDGVQFFFQCVAFQIVHASEARGAILTQLSYAHDEIIEDLSKAIFAWFKNDEVNLLQLIKSCCESEMLMEKEDSVFRGKTLSIVVCNLFNTTVNKSFNASVVKLLRETLLRCKKPVDLCMSARALNDYECKRNLLVGKLDATTLNSYFSQLSSEVLRKELENVPLEDFPKMPTLPKSTSNVSKNQSAFSDVTFGELPSDLKNKLLMFQESLTSSTKLAQLIGENASIPLLKDKIPVNQLSPQLLLEITKIHGNKFNDAKFSDLTAAKLEKGLREKAQSEVDRIYEQLINRLKTQIRCVHERKLIRQALQTLNKGELENILRRVPFTQLSDNFQYEYCEKVCKKNEGEFAKFMSNFLKPFYQMRLHQRSIKLLEVRREVIQKRFPQLEFPLTGNMLLLRWILPAIINDREWDKDPLHKSIVKTVAAILQQLTMEGEGENTQSWASVYKEIKDNYCKQHRDFIDRNSKSQETSIMLNLNQ